MPRYPAGVIRKTPVTPAGPLQSGAAPGMWTLAEAAYWVKQGLWPIAGNFLAVEDVFSTYLYTGNGSTQTITNGIDLAGKGGLVWIKSRSAATNNFLFDTTRGANVEINSNTTDANATLANSVTAFNSNGFALGSAAGINVNAATYASWTFRKAPKFFDVVTYTGTGSARTIAHNLGIAPGCIIVKQTSGTENWRVYHRSTGNGQSLYLNTTDAALGTSVWNSTSPTSTDFTVSGSPAVNGNGDTYVAYLFAHDATADGIIQCGSFTTDASGNATVNLGWEPQWLMAKCSSLGGPWVMTDIMRGMTASGSDAVLLANSSGAETTTTTYAPTATGFTVADLNGSATYIYIAIRRGPMKTPTVGTSVFAPVLGSAGTPGYKTTFTVDTIIEAYRPSSSPGMSSRLTAPNIMTTFQTGAEQASSTNKFDYMNGWSSAASDSNFVAWSFRRAPGFFDMVCYTGNSVAGRAVNHNLGVAPELMIVKVRNAVNGWPVYNKDVGVVNSLTLQGNFAAANIGPVWNSTAPTSSVFYVGNTDPVNLSGNTYVAYLFASCPGVSKVGSYTGNGSSQTINCGFSNGARFFLVKRTDSSGDWWVYDSARGIVAAADPALTLNTTAAEVTSADAVDTNSTGIIVNQEATCNINVNGATYIFLAIA